MRGNLQLYAIIGLAGLGLLSLLVIAIKGYIEGVDQRAFHRGVNETKAAYSKRDNDQIKAVTAERDRLRAEKEAIELARDAAIAEKEREYAQRNAQRQAEHDQFVADINSGVIVFRDPGGDRSSAACAGDREGAAASADPGDGGGPLGGRGLSAAAAGFLVAEATRANKVVAKLNLCRGVLGEIYGR